MTIRKIIGCCIVLLSSFTNHAQEVVKYNDPGAKNPVLPGYFADPTIVKFDSLYYIYATTDNEMLGSGAPTVWYSKDFHNWFNYTMEIPSLSSVNLRNFWAPDIIHGDNGKYYLYFGNCQSGCNIYGYVSTTPTGPWKKLHNDDTPVIPNDYPKKGFPSLDAQFFKDTDGKIYAYWGTWVHYNNGYAVGELNIKTMDAVSNGKNIPLEQTPAPFEAPYMMKKNNKYILMYSGASCHDETYNVRYAYSNNPYGPFTPGANNPILSTNEDKSVHGPGHHSVLKKDDDYYIVYHKHDYPFTRGGLARQVCMDKLIFENDSTIKAVVPTSSGVDYIETSTTPRDMAYRCNTSASSYYQLRSTQYQFDYLPAYATDNNNATMWKAARNDRPQSLLIDLGAVKEVKRIMTQFEFASYYYQYQIEYSTDKNKWSMYADKSKNRISGSPVIDDNSVLTRYIKLTVLRTEKMGLYAAVWNIKIYGSLFDIPLQLVNKPSSEGPAPYSSKKVLVNLSVNNATSAGSINQLMNKGSLGGTFTKTGKVILAKDEEGIMAINFKKGALTLNNVKIPATLAWNGSYTVAAWVKNPVVNKEDECLASWCDRHQFELANSYNALFYNSGPYGAGAHLDGHFDMRYNKVPTENKWHHIVLTFDGVVEKIYVDGILDNSQNMTLASATARAKIIIGASDTGENFSGYMASLRMYDQSLSENEIIELMDKTNPFIQRN